MDAVPSVNLANIPRGPPGPHSDGGASEISSFSLAARSEATTALATDVGSVIFAPKDAFLRSFTFQIKEVEEGQEADEEEPEWGIILVDITKSTRRFGRRSLKEQKIAVDSISGIMELSRLEEGDLLRSINGRRVGPSYNAERAMQLMNSRLQEERFLSVAVGNEHGSDVLVHATVLKSRPDLTYDEMGMVVWYWGVLCVKSIEEKSIWNKTVLKEGDHIMSINDISCDRMSPRKFAHVVNGLPLEITIEVRRGKQRWSGSFK